MYDLCYDAVCLWLSHGPMQWTKDPQTFEKMLDHVDVYLLNPLQHAVSKDAPVALVHAIISARPELLHSFDSRRRSLVHLAATANADAETMELLLKHLPAAVATVDLNRKLPVQYLLDHPDADTVGAQENIFALLRVHPAVLWQPVVRQQLLTVADAAEIADVVKTALRNEACLCASNLLAKTVFLPLGSDLLGALSS